MLTTWRDGVFEIEVDVEGCIECEGREWEVGSAHCADFKKAPHRTDHGKYYPVIREAGNTTDYFFLASYYKDSKTHERIFRPRPGFADEKFSPLSIWETFMPWALPLKAQCRVLWFNSEATEITTPQEAQWRLTLLSDGRGGWTPAQSSILLSKPDIPFEREGDAPLLEITNMGDWVRWVKMALRDKSDCRFAFDFKELNEEQRWQRVLRWKRGNREEFTRVCELIACSAIKWDADDDGVSLQLIIRPEEGLDIHVDWEPIKPQFSDFERIKRLYAWVYHTYIAPLGDSFCKHACVRDWLEGTDERIKSYIPPLSAHERMENLKLLIEWAEAEGIDGELKEILNSPSIPKFEL